MKREIIKEITGAVANFPRRSGYMLPPPVDDFVDRQIPKCVPNVSCQLFLESLDIFSSAVSVSIYIMRLCILYILLFGIFCFFLCRIHRVWLKLLAQIVATADLLLFLLEPYGTLNYCV